MASFQQTLRRRNRQHVPDVRDIFRPPDKVLTGTIRKNKLNNVFCSVDVKFFGAHLFHLFSFVVCNGTLINTSINESSDPHFKNTGTKCRQAVNQLSVREEKYLLLIFTRS